MICVCVYYNNDLCFGVLKQWFVFVCTTLMICVCVYYINDLCLFVLH